MRIIVVALMVNLLLFHPSVKTNDKAVWIIVMLFLIYNMFECAFSLIKWKLKQDRKQNKKKK